MTHIHLAKNIGGGPLARLLLLYAYRQFRCAPQSVNRNGGAPRRTTTGRAAGGGIRPQRGCALVNRLPSIARLSVGEHMRKRADGPPIMYFCQVGVCPISLAREHKRNPSRGWIARCSAKAARLRSCRQANRKAIVSFIGETFGHYSSSHICKSLAFAAKFQDAKCMDSHNENGKGAPRCGVRLFRFMVRCEP